MAKKKKDQQKKTIKEKRPEIDGLKDQLARALADYDNLKKRVEKEREDVLTLASVIFLEKLLPVFDMLFSAQNHLKDTGLQKVVDELRKVLESEGFTDIKAEKGDIFNENYMEAVDAIDENDKNKKGKIAEVMLTGWMTKDDRVIRPTKVRVYR